LLGIIFSSIRSNLNFFHEIFPYQWRVAVSWISGYFIFQVFNPVLFATEGPIVAGQMGLTLTVLSGISSLSMSWITTKIQNFSTLISKSEFKKLDELFITSFKQSVIINLLLLIVFVILKIILDTYFIKFSNRFLPIIPIILLSLVTLANQFVFSWATYIRCHKSEPFLLNSIIGAALNIASIYFLGHKFGLIGIVVGYFFITIFIGLPWVYIVFKKKKIEWH
jgi:O-antigen/teichoic acid export membrane protein